MSVVLGRAREPDVRVDRARRAAPFCPCASRSTLSNSCARAERRAADLRAADRLLLVGERRAVPDLDQHPDPPRRRGTCRRAATRAVDASDPDVLGERVGVLELDVVRAVLEAHQVARRVLRAARRGRAAEAELRPAHHDDAAAEPREVAHGVERDLRVVGARLDAEVAAALAPGRARRPPNAGSSTQRAGRFDARPKRSCRRRKRRRPEAERDRQPRGREPDRLAGVVAAARSESSFDRPGGLAGASSAQPPPSTSAAGRGRPRRESVTMSKAAKCSRSCAGVAMPGLVRAVERDRASPRRDASPSSVRRSTPRPPSASAAPPTPAPSSSLRRLNAAVAHPAVVVSTARPSDDDRADLRQRLGERVDRLRELARVGRRQLRVRDEAVARR